MRNPSTDTQTAMARPSIVSRGLLVKMAKLQLAGLDHITISTVCAVSYSTVRRALNGPVGKQVLAELRAANVRERVDLGLIPAPKQPNRAGQVKLNWGVVPSPQPPKPSAAVYIPRHIPDEV
jgi:hypothetical protein